MRIYTIYLFIILILSSCGYPDINSVPEFTDIDLTDDEINDYCRNTNFDETNIDNCINNYKK